MKFEADRKEAVLLNPAKGMTEKRIPVEIRKDPLTGRTSRICHFMALAWEKPDLAAIAANTVEKCPFCPKSVLTVTPCFPENLIPEGRMTLDDLVLFPNLAPYDPLSAVATLGGRHYIPMTEISEETITKGFLLAMAYFRRIHALGYPESVYPIANWNYMPPAGSSIIHPHLQVFVTASAPNLMRQELEAAKAYMDTNGSNFWEDLAEYEKKAGERFLGSIGRTSWMTAFAPMGVAGDVLAVVHDVSHTLDLTDNDLRHLARGLTRLMKAYDAMGLYSFNMNFFTGARNDDFARFHILFSPRTYFNAALGTPDAAALRTLFNETVCMAFPEAIHQHLKGAFSISNTR
ncbi:MAG: hypothetical protein JRI83_01430 [Deltaproteobacteria bacterium]|nr:hypothetical protein [Deltaproteobacteria bacterium]MBW1954366.1 hypothetical protein [Deltaproteobacteria bacterium]